MNSLLKMMLLSKARGHQHSDGESASEYGVCPAARYWEQSCYHDYMKLNGKHFSRDLAKWAVAKNVWSYKTGSGQYWTPEQVTAALNELGVEITSKTKFDAYYLANTMYADHAGAIFTDAHILQLTADIMADKDGYEGMIFDMWLTKAMGHCWDIPFAELM